MSTPATISPEVTAQLAAILQEKFGFTTQTQLDKAVLDIVRKGEEKYSARGGARRNTFSLSTMVRGMCAQLRVPITQETAEADVQYIKSLTTGATPGSYLVPTIQADEIIQFLETGGILRAAGPRIWPCAGIQKLTVPVATASPAWVWMAF
jgi:hypothetical protein